MIRIRPILAAAAVTLLAGCGQADVKETLGLNRKAPDEYRVMPRPPLSMPPEFNLRPPGQGSEYSGGLPADARAHNEVLGVGPETSHVSLATGEKAEGSEDTSVTPVTASELPAGSDAQFLSNAGAAKKDPHVRQEILDESGKDLSQKDSHYLWGGSKEVDTTVDATKEAQRIKDDKSQGKPVTAGDTPVVEPKSKGLLGDLF